MNSHIDDLMKQRKEIDGYATEVLDQLYQAILKTPELTLASGVKASVSAYYSPQVSEDGDLSCGFDVHLDNGTDLEFRVENTGSGRRIGPATKGEGRSGRG